MKLLNKLNKYSLRSVFSGTVFVLMVINFLVIAFSEYIDHRNITIYSKKQEMHRLLNQISDVVEYNLINKNENNLDSYLSNLSTDSSISLILVVDENEKIIHSTKRKWTGENAFFALSFFIEKDFLLNSVKTRKTNSIAIDLMDSKNLLFGSVPIFYIKDNKSIRDIKTGSIFLIFDLNKFFREELSSMLIKVFLSLLRAFAIFLVLYFLFDFLVSKRIGLLLGNIKKTMGGNLNFDFRIPGNDEISVISNAFQEMTERLKKNLYYDPVTGAYNRLALELKSHEFFKNTSQFRALIVIDIDNFKEINDIYGHKIGDLCLKEFSSNLILLIKDGMVGRIGGDEFIVITKPFQTKEMINIYINDLFTKFKASFVLGENIFELKSTLGVAIFPENGYDFKSLYKNADIALFHGKTQGKDNFTFINNTIIQRIERRNFIIQQIKLPTFYNELLIYYQPVVSIKENKIVCFEALLRWNSPILGMVSPMELIPILEETGRVKELGRWLLVNVIKQIHYWEENGYSVAVNINVSFQEFSQKDFPGFIEKKIKESGISPSRIKLEITESEIMRNLDQTLKNLNEIREIGLELAIDDFGTGYSSLSYLKTLPVTHLKIDKSFISDIPKDHNDAILVNTIMKLSHTFGFIVIAEGVETKEQWDFLADSGCDEIQGFFISPPVPAIQVDQLLKSDQNTLHN